MSGLTTHILDTTLGRPAAGVAVVLERPAGAGWETVTSLETDDNGRGILIAAGAPFPAGSYRLSFATGAYFERLGTSSFYPEVTVRFEVRAPEEHHHVPLLLSPFGYSTYRGS